MKTLKCRYRFILPRCFPPKGFDMKNRPKPRIRSVDYHLECCIEARFWKIASTRKKSLVWMKWGNKKGRAVSGPAYGEEEKWIYFFKNFRLPYPARPIKVETRKSMVVGSGTGSAAVSDPTKRSICQSPL